MLAKCSVFIATSLDGFIARDDGSIDWLTKASELVPSGEDGGYKEFISTVDGLIMGRHSFEKVLSFDPWPYGELPVVVMSSKSIKIPTHLKHVSTSSETPLELVKRLTDEGFKHLYIDFIKIIKDFTIRINSFSVFLKDHCFFLLFCDVGGHQCFSGAWPVAATREAGPGAGGRAALQGPQRASAPRRCLV